MSKQKGAGLSRIILMIMKQNDTLQLDFERDVLAVINLPVGEQEGLLSLTVQRAACET